MKKRAWKRWGAAGVLGAFLLALIGCVQTVFSNSPPVPGTETGQTVTVLLYHDIAPDASPDTPATVSVRQFEQHLRALSEHGYRIIDMERFRKFILEGASVPDHAVLITFDDGYQSFYRYAYPILKAAGATGSVFVIGASSDLYNPDALPHLTWDEMRELKDNGMGIYNHSYNSHHYGEVSESGKGGPVLAEPVYLPNRKRMETDEEFRRRAGSDLAFMEKRLSEELGEAPGIMAIPYGAYNRVLLEEGRKAGISMFFTTEEGAAGPGRQEIPRINAGEPDMDGEALIAAIRKAAQP